MIEDILSIYNASSPSERVEGKDWYQNVNRFATALAERYDKPVPVIVATLAVLSPRCSWRLVCQTVTRMLSALDAGKDISKMRWPGLGINVEKAVGILTTGDIDRYLFGDKVRSFYDNILRPVESDRVTVDAWTWRVIYGLESSSGNIPVKVYHDIESAYQAAAERVGLPAHHLQAVTWLTIKRLYRTPAGQLVLF